VDSSPGSGLGGLLEFSNRYNFAAFLPSIKHVSPLLHHLGSVGQIVSMVIRTSDSIRFNMRELSLNPVG